MKVPSNSLPPGKEDDSVNNGQDVVSDEPIDSASIKGIFGWETVDDTNIPYILRRQRKFVSVRMVERKLLSKYPNTFPDELGKKDPLVSYFITEAEASLLNEINTAHCDFDYGQTPFSVKDLIVDLEEFEEFFKVVKKTFPADVLAKISEERVAPVMSPTIYSDLSQFCGWIQINNTVSPYIFRFDNGKQVRLVPLSVIVYAAGLLTNSSIDGLLPTPQECAMLNEACKIAGFDFSFGKNTRLISISEVLHRCQVQLFELPFKNPLQHARYVDPCTGQPSSSPLIGVMSYPQKLTASFMHKSPSSMIPPQGSVDSVKLNSYTSKFQQSAFHLPHMSTPANLSGVPVGLQSFHEPVSPSFMRQPRPRSRISRELSHFPGPRAHTDAVQENNNLVKQGLPGSLWATVSRVPPPAHLSNTASSAILSKTPPITHDPVGTSVYQPQSLPPNPLLHTVNCPTMPDLNHPIFRGHMSMPQRPLVARCVQKDLPGGIVRYPTVADLPLTQTQYSNLQNFPCGLNQFDSSFFAKTLPKDQRPEGDVHLSSSSSSSLSFRQSGEGESLKHVMPCSMDSIHRTPSNSGPAVEAKSHITATSDVVNTYNNNHSKTDFSHNISACLVNGKSISCINLDLPHGKERFCLVEAASKLYFPTVMLTEFVKVLEEVLKVKLHECTPQEERAFVQYYNLPVNKLKCNKIIRVDDLETYFPQLSYMFANCLSSNKQGQATGRLQSSPGHSVAQKRKSDSPCLGPPVKTVPPNLENVMGLLHSKSGAPQNVGESVIFTAA